MLPNSAWTTAFEQDKKPNGFVAEISDFLHSHNCLHLVLSLEQMEKPADKTMPESANKLILPDPLRRKRQVVCTC